MQRAVVDYRQREVADVGREVVSGGVHGVLLVGCCPVRLTGPQQPSQSQPVDQSDYRPPPQCASCHNTLNTLTTHSSDRSVLCCSSCRGQLETTVVSLNTICLLLPSHSSHHAFFPFTADGGADATHHLLQLHLTRFHLTLQQQSPQPILHALTRLTSHTQPPIHLPCHHRPYRRRLHYTHHRTPHHRTTIKARRHCTHCHTRPPASQRHSQRQ